MCFAWKVCSQFSGLVVRFRYFPDIPCILFWLVCPLSHALLSSGFQLHTFLNGLVCSHLQLPISLGPFMRTLLFDFWLLASNHVLQRCVCTHACVCVCMNLCLCLCVQGRPCIIYNTCTCASIQRYTTKFWRISCVLHCLLASWMAFVYRHSACDIKTLSIECELLLLSFLFFSSFFFLALSMSAHSDVAHTHTNYSSTVEIMIIIECLHLQNTLHFYWESIYKGIRWKIGYYGGGTYTTILYVIWMRYVSVSVWIVRMCIYVTPLQRALGM